MKAHTKVTIKDYNLIGQILNSLKLAIYETRNLRKAIATTQEKYPQFTKRVIRKWWNKFLTPEEQLYVFEYTPTCSENYDFEDYWNTPAYWYNRQDNPDAEEEVMVIHGGKYEYYDDGD